jgi:maltose-binding protein MalE
MNKKTMIWAIMILVLSTAIACSSNDQSQSSTTSSTSTTDSEDPYYMMHIAFEGMPEIEEFKPMLDAVMERYGIESNRENLLKVGNVLVTLRKESKVGVTEAELLKHIYQRGSSQVTFPEQAGASAVILEKTK